jgi:hypothetical protein
MRGDTSCLRKIAFATAFATLFVATQSLIARRFIAERERLADWRAMQSLSMPDAARLLGRRGTPRSGGPAPTELEKLMIDLKTAAVQAGGISSFSSITRILWPEGDSVRQRTEALAGDRAGPPASPLQWAALMGMQCGALATALILGVCLAAGPMQDRMSVWVVLGTMSWIGGANGIYCVMRTDPARLRLSGGTSTAEKIAAGVTFFLTFACGVFATELLAISLSARAWVSGLALAVGIVATIVLLVNLALLAALVSIFRTEEVLRMAPRERFISIVPHLIAIAIVLGLFNVALSSWLGLGGFLQGAWLAIMVCALVTSAVSTALANSSSAILRALAPFAVVNNSAPVYRFRFLWREFSLDMTRISLMRAGVVVFAYQAVVLVPLVIVFALAMRRVEQVADFKTTFAVFFWGAVGLFMLVILIPDREAKAGVDVLRMVERSRLEILSTLLTAARHADPSAAERIRSAIASWLSSDDRLIVALLPDRRSLPSLSSLRMFIRLAHAAGADGVLDGARERIESALKNMLTDDAVIVTPGEPPSLFYSTLVTAIVDDAGLADRFPCERMIDRIGSMLGEHLSQENVNFLTDVVAAARLLQAHGRPIPDAANVSRFVRRSTLMSKPALQQSLVELCELAELLGDAQEKERLAPMIRSRLWEVLQLNPRKEVRALLDHYLAAVHVGEGESPLASAAAMTIAEIAIRTADELRASRRAT